MRLLSLSTILFVLIFNGCATKEPPKVLNLAANRKMGLNIKITNSSSLSIEEVKAYFLKLSQAALEKTYGSKVVPLSMEVTSPLETPENLYEIGKSEVDDLFLLDIKIPMRFQIPATSNQAAPAENNLPVTSDIKVSGTVLNGANLRTVTIFNFSSPTDPLNTFETLFEASFAKSALASFPNANIYPKANTKHYADLLYVFSEEHEKNFHDTLTCENAPQRFMYYKWARDLYTIAQRRGLSNIVGQASETHQMTTRFDDASAKAKVLEDCLADAHKKFDLLIDYGAITPENQAFIQRAFESTNFPPLLKQYTDKPVRFRFQVEPNNSLSLFVDIRFDQKKYSAWTVNRIPQKVRNFQVLSLDPYYALMQKLVIFRASIPEAAPFSLKTAIASMKMMLSLTTLLNGEVSFAVDGKYSEQTKGVRMGYPSKVFLNIPGSDAKVINNKDEIIFQERGWIALGNCKTLDGTRTEDGLIYEFFGFPCR